MSWLAILSFLRRIPWQAWALVALCALLLALRWHWIGVGVERCQSAQEAAEARADRKAANVSKKAADKAQDARESIRKDTQDAAAEVRQLTPDSPSCPPVPERVHQLGREAVEAASAELPAG